MLIAAAAHAGSSDSDIQPPTPAPEPSQPAPSMDRVPPPSLSVLEAAPALVPCVLHGVVTTAGPGTGVWGHEEEGRLPGTPDTRL